MQLALNGSPLPYGQDVTLKIEGEDYVISYASLLIRAANDDLPDRVTVVEPVLPSLPTLKDRALAALADARWQACQTFTYDGVVAPADTALMAVTGYVVAANIAPPDGAQTWKLAPGHFRQWEATDVVAYGIAIRTHIQAAFDLEGERAALIDAAEDHEELAAVPITTGWPA